MYTAYFIHTFAREDRPEMVCAYPYAQWVEIKKSLDERGIPYTAWRDEVSP